MLSTLIGDSKWSKIQLKKGSTQWAKQLYPIPKELHVSQQLFQELWDIRPNKPSKVKIYGKLINVPRLQESYGRGYYYSGVYHKARPIPHKHVETLLKWVQEDSGLNYQQVLINWYDGPNKYIGPHSDDTTQLLPGSPIYCFSFGEQRKFVITSKSKPAERYVIPMPHNSLLVMSYDMQRNYKHSVPKSTKYTGKRISITFRCFKEDRKDRQDRKDRKT